MHKTDWLIIGTALTLLLIVIGVAYYAKTQSPANVLYYEGPGGTYRIDLVQHGTSLDYYVHAFVDNTNYIVPFSKSPYDVENVTMQEDILQKLERPQGIRNLYITQDLDLGNKTQQDAIVALTELAKVLGRAQFSVFKLPYHSAFTAADDRTQALKLPVVTCANVTNEDAVIYLRLAAETRVTSDEHDCIIIQGPNGRELLRATYRFLYHALGLF